MPESARDARRGRWGLFKRSCLGRARLGEHAEKERGTGSTSQDCRLNLPSHAETQIIFSFVAVNNTSIMTMIDGSIGLPNQCGANNRASVRRCVGASVPAANAQIGSPGPA